MRFFFDNNISHRLARAVSVLASGEPYEVFHRTDKFPGNTSDTTWISTLRAEGDWTVVSHDRFKKNPSEKEAFRRSGITIFELAQGWSQQLLWLHASQFLRWWPRIVEQSESVTGGATFLVPWQFSGNGKFKQL